MDKFRGIFEVFALSRSVSAGILLMCAGWFSAAAAPPGLTLISCDRESAVIEFELPGYQAVEQELDGETFTQLSISGWGNLIEEGKPALPQAGFLLAMPPGSRASLTVDVLESHTITLVNPQPAPAWLKDEDSEIPVEQYLPDPAQYASSTPYPQQWASVGDPFWCRTFYLVPVKVIPFRAVTASGEALVADKLRLKVSFHGGRQGTSISDPHGQALIRSSIINFAQARRWQEKTPPSVSSVTGEYGDYKLLVDEDGLYRITYSDLVQAGITSPETIDPQTIKIYLEGEEMPIWVDGNVWDGQFNTDDYIFFYGQIARGTYTYENIYTRTNTYWLDWGGAAGTRLTELDVTPGGGVTLVNSFKAKTRTEVDTLYESFGDVFSGEDVDHWMWLLLDATFNPEFSLLLDLPGLVVIPTEEYNLTASFRGFTTVDDHHVIVGWNDCPWPVINTYWDGQNAVVIEGTAVPGNYVGTGSVLDPNELVFTATPGELNSFYLDWFEVEYWRDFSVMNDTLLFQKPADIGPQPVRYKLTGLTDPDTTELWNLTTNQRLIGFETSADTLHFTSFTTDTTFFFAAGPQGWLTPQIVTDEPSDWSGTSHGADYIMITHEDFYSILEPLKDNYVGKGLRTELVKVGDIYDEFSYGMKNPQAIFDFIQHAFYNYQSPALSYVLLVGDASWDYKGNVAGSYQDFIPTYSFPTYKWGETASDNWYISVTGNDPIPDCAIGRFPANSVDEAQVLVDKALAYTESPPPGYWRSRIIFTNGANEMSDAIIFDTAVENLLNNYFPDWWEPPRVYWLPSPPYQQFQGDSTDLMEEINLGAAMVNYVGHAGNEMWYTLSVDNITSLENGMKLPFVASFSCYTGIFSNTTGMGEVFILKPDGGAVAYWSNGAVGFTTTNNWINDFLFAQSYSSAPSDPYTFGMITTDAKLEYWATFFSDPNDVIQTFSLLGDPGLTYLYEAPDPADTLNNPQPAMTFTVPGSPHFRSRDYVSNPVEFACSMYDPDGLDLPSLQMELIHLVDGIGNPVDTSWQWTWQPDSSAPPNFNFDLPDSLGDSLTVSYSNTLGDGEWQFFAGIADYLLNGPETLTTRFRTASAALALEDPLNYPNPFAEKTNFTFTLSQDAQVSIKIYTVSGKLVRALSLSPVVGFNIHEYDGRDHQGDQLSNGTYLYKIIASSGDQQVETVEKMIKIR